MQPINKATGGPRTDKKSILKNQEKDCEEEDCPLTKQSQGPQQEQGEKNREKAWDKRERGKRISFCTKRGFLVQNENPKAKTMPFSCQGLRKDRKIRRRMQGISLEVEGLCAE